MAEDSLEVLRWKTHELRYALDRWRTMKETMTAAGIYGPWLFATEPASRNRLQELDKLYEAPEYHKMHYALEKVYQCRSVFAQFASWQPFELTKEAEADKRVFEEKEKEISAAFQKLWWAQLEKEYKEPRKAEQQDK